MLGGQRFFVKKPISIIGFMGSGKTSVGKMLALNIGIDFTDTDQLIVQISKKTISEIINNYGIDEFREIESHAVKRAVTQRQVIATGGGCVEEAINREALKKTFVIWLKVDVKESAKRLKKFKNRPLFSDLENAQILLDKRTPIYKDMSDITINTKNKSIEDIVDEILKKLSSAGVISV